LKCVNFQDTLFIPKIRIFGTINLISLSGSREGSLLSKNYKEELTDLVKFQPGDKIYKLFKHQRVLVKGQKENFIIQIKKVK
jgi:hypothetical protein